MATMTYMYEFSDGATVGIPRCSSQSLPMSEPLSSCPPRRYSQTDKYPSTITKFIASNHNTGGLSELVQLCVSGILRLWLYILVRAPKAWGRFYTFFANSGYQSVQNSNSRCLAQRPKLPLRVESPVALRDPTSYPRTVETAPHGSFSGKGSGKRRLLQSF